MLPQKWPSGGVTFHFVNVALRMAVLYQSIKTYFKEVLFEHYVLLLNKYIKHLIYFCNWRSSLLRTRLQTNTSLTDRSCWTNFQSTRNGLGYWKCCHKRFSTNILDRERSRSPTGPQEVESKLMECRTMINSRRLQHKIWQLHHTNLTTSSYKFDNFIIQIWHPHHTTLATSVTIFGNFSITLLWLHHQTLATLSWNCWLNTLSRGAWTGVLGPVKLVRYPLSGGTLLFLVTVSLLLWGMYMIKKGDPNVHSQSKRVNRQRHLRGMG